MESEVPLLAGQTIPALKRLRDAIGANSKKKKRNL